MTVLRKPTHALQYNVPTILSVSTLTPPVNLSVCSLWQKKLSVLKQCFVLNGRMLNSIKTQCIFIGSRQILSRIPLDIFNNRDGDHIDPNTHVKNSALYFDVHVSEASQAVVGLLTFTDELPTILTNQHELLLYRRLCSVLWIIVYDCTSQIWPCYSSHTGTSLTDTARQIYMILRKASQCIRF